MRILAMTNLYPNPFQPHRAPFNRHRLRLLGARHPVQVISPISWTEELRARWSGAAALPRSRRVHHDGLIVDYPRFLFAPGWLRRSYGRSYYHSVRATFRRAVKEFRPTVVLAPWAYPDGWAAVQLGREVGLPVVIVVHGSDILLLSQFPGRRAGTEAAVRGADAVMAVSDDLRGRLVEMGVAEERIRVVYDGVDTAVFHPGSQVEARRRLGVEHGEPVVLFVGNLAPVKGINVLIDACGRLRDTGCPVHLFVVGNGPLRGALEQQTRKLQIGDRVRFLGSLAQTEIADWYRAADLFVLPSHSEGVPNVLLEASACGTPWVASRVGGIPEIASWGNSRLVPPNDPAALMTAMREALGGAHEKLKHFIRTREDSLDELEELLLSVESTKRALSLSGYENPVCS